MKKYNSYFDGACEPKNPGGNIGTGSIIFDRETQEEIFRNSGYFPAHPQNSNNMAEYMALKDILYHIIENMEAEDEIAVFGDSNLVIKQMSGAWRIKKGAYIKDAYECLGLVQRIRRKAIRISFEWIPREQNEIADQLSKEYCGR